MSIVSLDGAQVIARATSLLKLVGSRGDAGHSVAGLVLDTGLKRPTIHRLLCALQAAGFVEQDNATRRWFLGPEIATLGALAGREAAIEPLARDCLTRLAAQTGESVFISERRGSEVVCLVREEGSFPIRTHVLQAGDRLPLGVGSAGMAILACLSDSEIDIALDELAWLPVRGSSAPSPPLIRAALSEARRVGYAINRGMLLAGSWGMAAAVSGPAGHPVAALSITAVESRLPPARQPEVGELLVAEAAILSRRLQAQRTPKRERTG